MAMPREYIEQAWKERLDEDLWQRLDVLLDFFGPEAYGNITNLLILSYSNPLVAIETIECCKELIEREEKAHDPNLVNNSSEKRTARMALMIRAANSAQI